MHTQREHIVNPLLMLGILAMIFAVLAFAEKTREDGHLPERNGRGTGELTSIGVATAMAIFLIPVSPAGTGGTESRPEYHQHPVSMGMRCSPGLIFL